MHLINKYTDQANKIRASLRDFVNEPDKIERPLICHDCGAFGGESGTVCDVCHRGMVWPLMN
jgi:hypothetical protein